MSNGNPVFDYNQCMACGICVQACPFGCLKCSKTDIDSYKKAYPQLESDKQCKGCKICENACPVDAIKVK